MSLVTGRWAACAPSPARLPRNSGFWRSSSRCAELFTLKQPGYISSFNLFAMGRSLAVDVVIGFSQMVVLATGGMNLSVGSIGVCSVMLSGYLMQTLGLPVSIAFLLALALGGALGWLNGFTIVKSGSVPSSLRSPARTSFPAPC